MALDHEKLKGTRAGSGRTNRGWRPKAGENRVRILPPGSRFLQAWDTLENLAVPFKAHFFKIEGRPTEVSRCLEELKQKCPACMAWRTWRKSEDPAMQQLAKKVAPADQYLFNILDINSLQAGIQPWASNYTCWDKIMEIGCNPAWGNVVDPANGLNFVVTMTDGAKSRTGWNQYSVLPEPEHTTVMEILDAIPDWQQVLDNLESQIAEPKEVSEIEALLDEMGFPPPPGKVTLARPAAPVAPAPTAPRAVRPAAAPTPTALPAGPRPVASARPVPVAVAAPRSVARAAPTPGKVTLARPAAPVAPAPTASDNAEGPHYDPGEDYTPVVADDERPAGVPRCYGDYNPQLHRCQPCPVMTECQLKLMGISTD